jgi:hypothetical protein
MFESTTHPTIAAFGTNWCASSTRFATSALLVRVERLTTVTLPLVWSTLVIRPRLTGSPATMATIGIVVVAAIAARVTLSLPLVTIRATCR